MGLFYQWLNTRKQVNGMKEIHRKYGEALPSLEDYDNPIAYSLPFVGEWLVVNGGVTEEFSHSWQVTSQRYAYDFIMVDEGGQSFHGNERRPESYICYAQPILAPADGLVVEVHDGEPDSLILGNGRYRICSKHIAGNYVIIKHRSPDGKAVEYSTLAHLANGSIRVHIGDTVRRGERIAACGNTGNSSEPHLHFQIQSGEDFFASYTYPILFENINQRICAFFTEMDPRSVLPPEKLMAGRISRGYLVSE